jgi:AmmeMemoRadiSam system protein B
MFIRQPVVAGQFYPGDQKSLENMIGSLIPKGKSPAQKNRVKALILPHAAYIYSGKVAAQTVDSAELLQTIIILGPNHTGLGKPYSIMTEGKWQTPLGAVAINQKLAAQIAGNSSYLKSDTLAHDQEHSIEVLLPFLQYFIKEFTIVPIIIMRADYAVYRAIADDIFKAITALSVEKEVLLVASSDMTHYEPQDSAKKKDRYAIESILKLDAENLLERVEEKNISMCGVAPVTVMLELARKLGAKEAHLVKYQTSGDTTGDYQSVVGYAGITIN